MRNMYWKMVAERGGVLNPGPDPLKYYICLRSIRCLFFHLSVVQLTEWLQSVSVILDDVSQPVQTHSSEGRSLAPAPNPEKTSWTRKKFQVSFEIWKRYSFGRICCNLAVSFNCGRSQFLLVVELYLETEFNIVITDTVWMKWCCFTK